MRNTFQIIVAIFALALLGSSATVFAQAPTIVSTSPTQNELNVSVNTNISVTFDVDMDSTTINDTTFVVNARSTGLHEGTISFLFDTIDVQIDTTVIGSDTVFDTTFFLTTTATFDPSIDFAVGEVVTVVLTKDIQSTQGIPPDRSYTWSFTILTSGGEGTFVVSSAYPVGSFPNSIFAADLDDDGDLDLATANRFDSVTSVLLNNGNGTFAPHSVYPVGLSPFSVFVADLDGDGNLDLTTANSISDNVSVLLSNGDGTFAAHEVYPVGDCPMGVFVADLDGDGDLDLVTGHPNGTVSVMMNNGDATFGACSDYPCGAPGEELIAADLDGDGDLDLAIADSDLSPAGTQVSVMMNNGDGTFGPYALYPVGLCPRSLFAADLDGDGDLDLTTPNYFSDNVSILLNNGDGTFASQSIYPVGNAPLRGFAADADVDGDGDLDLAIPSGAESAVSVLLNNGDGTFAPYSAYPVNDRPIFLFAADLDGDGDIDLVTANGPSDNVSVLLNQGTFICGDINNDGEGPNVEDLTYLVDYLFFGSPPPPVMQATNVDGEGGLNVADLIYLVEYLFFDGPEPNCQPIQ